MINFHCIIRIVKVFFPQMFLEKELETWIEDVLHTDRTVCVEDLFMKNELK